MYRGPVVTGLSGFVGCVVCQRCAVGAAGGFARGFARGAGVWGGWCGCIVGFVGPEAWLLGVVQNFCRFVYPLERLLSPLTARAQRSARGCRWLE